MDGCRACDLFSQDSERKARELGENLARTVPKQTSWSVSSITAAGADHWGIMHQPCWLGERDHLE